jgi:VIT1/CCC1 family predicted Fe2+/Mn2+ transporter
MIFSHDPESDRLPDVVRHYIGDIVFGANDGIITTFAVVSGVAGAELSPAVILIMGIANLLGDGFSMGASNYLSIRSVAGAEGKDRGVAEPLLHAFMTFGAFVIIGGIPLLAYLVPAMRQHAFLASSASTAVVLFLVGSMRSLIMQRGWIRSGLEMLLVGAVAAGAAYAAGWLVSGWVR